MLDKHPSGQQNCILIMRTFPWCSSDNNFVMVAVISNALQKNTQNAMEFENHQGIRPSHPMDHEEF